MGRAKQVRGPVSFMPSDGKFLGSKDLQGLPIGKDDERIVMRCVEVVEYPPGEVLNGVKNPKAFWAMLFDRPGPSGWKRSRKEWKLGPTVVGRLSFRLGTDVTRWPGAEIPVRLEVTSFGRDDVYCIRPVPLPMESDPQRRREAMRQIAAGTYDPPGLATPREPAPQETTSEPEPDPVPDEELFT